MNSLRLTNLTKSFGATTALHNLSLDFEPGSVTAIVGDNGASKSTLCKTITGVCRPSDGTVTLADTRLTDLTPREIRAAGVEMVYQDLALVEQQDIVSNLFLGRERTIPFFGILKRREMHEAARSLLHEIGITISELGVPVRNLSGGQKQAIAIARALLFSPRVLIMDEPTAALAAKEIEHVLELIRQSRARNIIVILVSHRLNDVFAVSDRIVTLRSGAVVADSPAQNTSMQEVVSNIVGAQNA